LNILIAILDILDHENTCNFKPETEREKKKELLIIYNDVQSFEGIMYLYIQNILKKVYKHDYWIYFLYWKSGFN